MNAHVEVRPADDWFEDGGNVSNLIAYLDENSALGDEPVKTICYLVAKPWKWEPEYRRMLNGLEPDEERCDLCGQPEDADWLKKHGQCGPCLDREEEADDPTHYPEVPDREQMEAR